MAKTIYICFRETPPASVKMQLHKICKKIEPDNINPTEPMVVVNGDIAYGIMNPNKTLLEFENSLLMGQIFDKDEKWNVPHQQFPDGSYALFRNGKEDLEIVADPVASRTIWYYMDETKFIASTSQRAIVMFIGSFEFDETVIPWMLSTGSIGPTLSWDKRIKRLPPDSSVILNKNNWSITTKSNPIEFNLVKRSDAEHENLLRESLKATFKTLNLDYSNWVLPLSGGYDSRGILCLLHNTPTNLHHLRTITWGLESSLKVKGNDAFVAKELANTLKVSHKYFNTDLSEESIDVIIDRFVLLGEGRIDHISAYMDGFKIWKILFEDGVQGIVRGDEGFGWTPVSSPLTLRIAVGCPLCSDTSNLRNYMEYGFQAQELPEQLNQRKAETLHQWRDRLYHEYRLPTILSALSDLKFSYVEQINPLLSKKILQQVRQLPDHLRTEKALFKKIVISLSPEVDFAISGANAEPKNILRQKQFVNLLKKGLSSDGAKKLFPAKFLDFVSNGIKTEAQTKTVKANSFSLKSTIIRYVPRFIKNIIRDKVSLPGVDHNILAFRVLLISKMNKVLTDDCKL
ncbi:MAG: hypothetical protein JJE22_12805 [Bacteroidia bacterium]|nr:hypothetical protein [Bacteroidia bacterium]